MSNKITQIYESFDEDDVNRYLADGWEIIAVVSGNRPYGPDQNMEIGPVYVLGRGEPMASTEQPLGLPLPTVSRVSPKRR